MPGNRSYAAIRRIDLNIVVSSVTLEVATVFDEFAHELTALHSEIASSCFSCGTKAFSAASAMSRW